MPYMHITPATVYTSDESDLRAAFRTFNSDPLTSVLVGTFVITTPLTPRQLRRLPKALRARLVQEVQS